MNDHHVAATYWIGDIVYLRVASECERGIVTAVHILGSGGISYSVTWPDRSEEQHYDCELSDEFVPDLRTY